MKYKPGRQTWQWDIVVDYRYIKSSREVQKAETWDLLCADSANDMVMNVAQSNFSEMVLTRGSGRLVRVKKIVSRGEWLMETLQHVQLF